MSELTKNLREEIGALDALLREHGDAVGTLKTQFKAWTGWDVIAHLLYSDHMAIAAARDGADGLNVYINAVMTAMSEGKSLIELTREQFTGVSFGKLTERWRTDAVSMADIFDATDPEVRLPWFGPPMKVRMFATARQMEIWAHSLALYDALGVDRVETDRISDIVFIGVRTYKFCFANRQQDVPGPMPYLDLVSPSGAAWQHGDPSTTNTIRGSAAEFARVVTQTRSIADTQLEVIGDTARAWMDIAQCFAGPPNDPPAPGTRFRAAN